MIQMHIIGNLGRDPEVKPYGSEGKNLTRFNVAANYRVGKENKTEWVNVTVFGVGGEVAAKYLHKGSKVYVTGRPSAHSYKNKLDEQVAGLDLIADHFEFLDSKGDSERQDSDTSSANGGQGGSFAPVASDDLPF